MLPKTIRPWAQKRMVDFLGDEDAAAEMVDFVMSSLEVKRGVALGRGRCILTYRAPDARLLAGTWDRGVHRGAARHRFG